MWPRRLSLPEDLKSGWHCNRPDDVCQMNNLAGHLASLQGGEMAAPLSLVLEPGDRKGGIVSGGPGGEEGEAFAVSDNKVCSFLPASLPHSGLYFGKSYFFFFSWTLLSPLWDHGFSQSPLLAGGARRVTPQVAWACETQVDA